MMQNSLDNITLKIVVRKKVANLWPTCDIICTSVSHFCTSCILYNNKRTTIIIPLHGGLSRRQTVLNQSEQNRQIRFLTFVGQMSKNDLFLFSG
jgi:hypothetical protein